MRIDVALNIAYYRNSKLTNTSSKYRFYDFVQKPIAIYVFVDPLCSECWSLEPYLKKLSIEYGRFFSIIPIISKHLQVVNYNQYSHHTAKHPALFPSISLSVKKIA